MVKHINESEIILSCGFLNLIKQNITNKFLSTSSWLVGDVV